MSLRVLLKDISLGYFYGAKIGVIGLNGSGKSTLLRIMAGVEKEFIGEVAISPGYSVGFLEEEPRLDPSKTVLEVVKEGSADTVRLLAEFEAISDAFAQPMEPDEMDKLLIEDAEFSIPPAAIVGIIGPNGAGKTTLFKMIVGEEKPDAGKLRLGETVQIAYADQSRADLKPAKTVYEVISEGLDEVQLGKVKMNARAYCSRFNFSGADQQKKVSQLSGGERNRVHLARMLKEGANVLLLDEPTNDLDVNTLHALEDALDQFAGCVVVISHDRWFLDRIATHILAFEGESKVTFFDGNFSEYEDWRKQTLGDAATHPHRITYRRLTR